MPAQSLSQPQPHLGWRSCVQLCHQWQTCKCTSRAGVSILIYHDITPRGIHLGKIKSSGEMESQEAMKVTHRSEAATVAPIKEVPAPSAGLMSSGSMKALRLGSCLPLPLPRFLKALWRRAAPRAMATATRAAVIGAVKLLPLCSETQRERVRPRHSAWIPMQCSLIYFPESDPCMVERSQRARCRKKKGGVVLGGLFYLGS